MLLRNGTIADAGLSPDRLANISNQMLSNTPTAIDLTSTSNTTVATIASGSQALITGFLLHVTAIADLTVAPIVSAGTSPGPVGSNLFAATSLAGLSSAGQAWVFWTTVGSGIIASSSVSGDTSDIIFSVTQAATATTFTADLYILGNLSNAS